MEETNPKLIYFVGTNLGHAVTNKIHDLVAQELNVNWRLCALDNPLLDDFVSRLHRDDFGGAVVTIPHKIEVMKHLDRLDQMASTLGACNLVYKTPEGLLAGTNTDWIGVRDALLEIAKQLDGSNLATTVSDGKPYGYGRPAFVIGAGGAARAAIYTLNTVLGAQKIYIINRDDSEVAALVRDLTQGYQKASLAVPSIIHLQEPITLGDEECPFFGVGTVPDFEAITPQEIQCRAIFDNLLSRSKGVFLDMCYKPKITRNLRLAMERGWATGNGGQIVGWQLKTQWQFWAGKDVSDAIPLEKMIKNVHEIVDGLP